MPSFSKRFVVSASLLLLCALAWIVFACGGKQSRSVTSNQVTAEQIRELKQKAGEGDGASLYALTLYTDDANEAQNLLKKAAATGYPPAMTTLAESLLEAQPPAIDRARALLESAARKGYSPAMVTLVRCLEAGRCGQESKVEAYAWIVAANLLAKQGKIEKVQLIEEERRLLASLNEGDRDRAQRMAGNLAERMSVLISR